MPQIWTGAPRRDEWFDQFPFEEVGWGEMVAITHPEVLAEEYRLLLDIGVDAISTPTLAAVPELMKEFAGEAYAAKANLESARVARAAAAKYSTAERPVKVLGAVGPTCHLVSFMGGGPEVESRLETEYRLQVQALIHGGVDLIHLESCMDVKNAEIALSVIRDFAVPFAITGKIEMVGTLLDGTSPEAFIDFARKHNPVHIGITGEHPILVAALDDLRPTGKLPSVALVNVFRPGCEDAWLPPVRFQPADIPIIGINLIPRPAYLAELLR